MFYPDLILLLGFFLIIFLLAWVLSKKIIWDKRNRKKTLENLFFGTFGFVALFFALDPWFLIGKIVSKEGEKIVGIGGYFEWWGPVAFITGVFIGIVILAFIYKNLQKIVLEFDIRNFFGFLKVRYAKIKILISIIAYISMFIFLPLFFYQVKLLSEVVRPFSNPYFSLAFISALMVLLFFFLGNKDRVVTYLAILVVFLAWFILSFVNTYQNQVVDPYFFSAPPAELFGTVVFLGLSFYLVFPKNFLAYTDRKIDLLGIPTLSRSLFFGGIVVLALLFFFMPYGGWIIQGGKGNQQVFLLLLVMGAALSYLYVLRIVFYESFKKYTLRTRNLSTIVASAVFMVTMLLGNYLLDFFHLDYSQLAFTSLTYVPVLIPGFLGGFIFKRGKGLNFILSYLGGFALWFYLTIGVHFFTFKLDFFTLESNLVSQTFYPFVAAVVLYLVPLILPRKPDMIAMSFTHPEKVIIESFVMDIETRKGS